MRTIANSKNIRPPSLTVQLQQQEEKRRRGGGGRRKGPIIQEIRSGWKQNCLLLSRFFKELEQNSHTCSSGNILLVLNSKSEMTCGIRQLIWQDKILGQSLIRGHTHTQRAQYSVAPKTAAVWHTKVSPGSFLTGVPALHCCLCQSRQQTALVVRDGYSLTCSKLHWSHKWLHTLTHTHWIF